jgi:hypothetical protein
MGGRSITAGRVWTSESGHPQAPHGPRTRRPAAAQDYKFSAVRKEGKREENNPDCEIRRTGVRERSRVAQKLPSPAPSRNPVATR